MRRVRPALRDVVEPVASQADAPQRRRRARTAVSALPQGLRLDAGAVDAPADARPQVPLLVVRQGVLAAVAAARTRALPHRRKTIHLRHVWIKLSAFPSAIHLPSVFPVLLPLPSSSFNYQYGGSTLLTRTSAEGLQKLTDKVNHLGYRLWTYKWTQPSLAPCSV